MQRPRAEKGTTCPLHRKDVSKVCHECEWFVAVRGMHPQTGEEIDKWACAIAWGPQMLINVAREVRGGAAATESFRNEVVARSAGSKRPRLIGKDD
jgi:hypothetical protein